VLPQGRGVQVGDPEKSGILGDTVLERCFEGLVWAGGEGGGSGLPEGGREQTHPKEE
jgi:hypothetical protein